MNFKGKESGMQVSEKIRSALAAVCAIASAAAAGGDAVWNGSAGADPVIDGNWSGGAMPGSLSDTGTRDKATFRGSAADGRLAPSKDWYIGSIVFQEYNGGATGWKLGTGAAGDSVIHLCGIGSGSAAFSASSVADTVVDMAGPLVLESNYQFSCDSALDSCSLMIGRVSASSVSCSMQLKGSGRTGVVYGPVSDGGGSVNIVKLHDGTWTLRGDNTFTGIVNIQRGTLIAGGDVGAAGTPGPFGANSSYAGGLGVRVGDQNPTADGFAALLLGYNDDGTPAVFARETTSQLNNKSYSYPAHFGGANTNGVTKFTSAVRSSRPTVLKCAPGGTVAFTGTFNPNDREVSVGTADFTGTVRMETDLATAGGVSVDCGTLDMRAELKAVTEVNAGAAITGSSADGSVVSGALHVKALGILAGSEGGVLRITGPLSVSAGAVLRFPVAERSSPLVEVGSALSLAELTVRLETTGTNPSHDFPLLTAQGGLSDFDRLDAGGLPRHCKVLVKGNTLYGRFDPGLVISIR